MKAIVQSKYGPPGDVLRLQEIDEPTIGDDDVLVAVAAASIHVGDVYTVKGLPYALRPVFRATGARSRVPGSDIAGTVEAVGPKVTRFEVGDDLFGSCKGAFAEYAATSQDLLASRPPDTTFTEASALGVSALTALQAIRDHGKLQPGQRVLITGASGGVGTFAVQIAKSLGAEVTGVCSTRNLDLVRSIGADHVIDYTKVDYTAGGPNYDLVLDNIGNHSLSATRRAVAPGGVLLSNGSTISGWFGGLGHVMKAMITSIVVKKQGRPFISLPNTDDLTTLGEMAAAGTITPVIDRVFPLAQTAEAVSHVGQGHAQGKTVITM